MAPTCSSCNVALNHITGHSVIRLFRCGKCGSQVMLPGDPNAPEPEVPVAAAAASAPAPAPEKKSWFSKIFGS